MTFPLERHSMLDSLVWHALATVHARFARGGELARRYDPEVTGFAAIRDGSREAWAALAELAAPGELLLLTGTVPIEPPTDWTLAGRGPGYQLVLPELGPAPDADLGPDGIRPLTTDDVPQILALVKLTRPGPFRVRTIELGNFVGVFDDGELVAMAGERLQTPEYAEISAVCTHPTVRGRGLAAALTHHVASGIVARGQTPLLHVAEHNHTARRVYERLGFVERARPMFVAVRTPPSAA